MRTLIILISLLGFCGVAQAVEVIEPELVCNAIYKAEGGVRAKVPYGILSVSCDSEASCRKICLNTVKNNLARWQWARQNGDKRDYIKFLADRYCPLGANNDPKGLNRHWEANVRQLYAVELKKGV